jgi:hypothetical protein
MSEVSRPFVVKKHRLNPPNLPRQSGLAHLTRAKQGNGGVLRQRFAQPGRNVALNHPC